MRLTVHSDRARYVTDQVSVWIVNDAQHFGGARQMIDTLESNESLGVFLSGIIRSARPYSAAWQVAQELAPNDYGRIRWEDVARQLIGE